jgi:tryptophan-rich sensory protein
MWKKVATFIIALVVCFAASGIGALVSTQQDIGTWYAQLRKPVFTPPDYVFGPVWTLLFFLMAISAHLVWSKGLGQPGVKPALLCFLIQLILNAIWTPLFFGMHLILAAFIEIIFLWLAIVVTLLTFSRVSWPATLLLVPYILWVSFAAVLNGSIWYLNR